MQIEKHLSLKSFLKITSLLISKQFSWIDMEKISGTIEQIVFSSPDTGFCVAKLNAEETITVVGQMPYLQPGETISCQGEWIKHAKFGKQFSVKEYSIQRPCDVDAIQKYLESGLIKGIGPAYAKKIVKTFGKETLKIIDESPDRLFEIEGIGKKKVDTIKNSWDEQRSIRDVMIFLRSCGVTPAYAQKIFKVYGTESIEKVRENPYRLAKDVFGIGFKMADQIASQLGIEATSNKRVDAGIEHVLWELVGDGNTCFPKQEFTEMSHVMLGVEKDLVEQRVDHLIKEERLELKRDFLFLKTLYHTEKSIAKEVYRLLNAKSKIRSIIQEKAITWVEEKLQINFAENQKLATLKSLTEKIHLITGGPGTGKSTITNAILAITEKLTNKIVLTAPTGRAAKRLQQITRKKAHTIHSLLEYDFSTGGFKKNPDNQIKADLLIIDEASMIDTFLLYHLLRAIPDACRVIFVGDIDQLPSVGPGSVLKDLIDSELLCVTRLNEIFRQAKGSMIVVNAHKVNQGEFPYLKTEKSDFLFFEENEPEKIQEKIVNLVTTDLPQHKNFDPITQIQVLCPMRKGVLGIEAINTLLQEKLNPSKKPFFRGTKRFHVKDKVMQIKNNYNKNVYNGDVGTIQEIDLEEQILYVNFDKREVEYDFSELEELVLAYAVSVHKYQGSECPCIVMPIHTSHFKLLYRNLLYTAITRGKRQVALVGSKKALAICIKNDQIQKRYTGLKEALIEENSGLSIPIS